MNSRRKLSMAALERLFQQGSPFKNSNGGITVKSEYNDELRGPLAFHHTPTHFLLNLPGKFSIASDEYTRKVKFHLYGIEFGLETLSDELLKDKVLLFYSIACNPRSVSTGRIPFYLIVEAQHHHIDTNKINRWCVFYTFTEEERKEFEKYCLAEAIK